MRAALTFMIVFGVSAAAQAQTMGLPLPSIGLPLPEIGLALPPMGLSPLHTAPQPAMQPSVPPAATRRPSDSVHAGRDTRTVVYFVPVYGWPGFGGPLPGPPAPPLAPPPPVAPPPAEQLQPVAEPQPAIDARDATADVPTPAPSTIYMIPGCYVGNVPPQQVTLPAGCDPSRASVFPSLR